VLQYAMSLGRHVPDDQLQRLASFMFRLSGTADSIAVENARLDLLWIETTRLICQPYGKANTKEVHSVDDAEAWAFEERRVNAGPLRITAIFYKIGLPRFGSIVRSVRISVDVAFSAIRRLERPELWSITFDILDRTIKLGRSESIDPHLGAARLRAGRQRMPALIEQQRSVHASLTSV
jgi:hypothetical protein